MILTLSISALLVIIFSFLKGNYKLLTSLAILSLIGDLFSINIGGVRMLMISLISLIVLVFFVFGSLSKYESYFKFKLTLKYEILLLFCTGIIFTIFLPWQTMFKSVLPFTQKLEVKAVVGFIRILSDIMIVLSIPILLSKSNFKKQYLSKFIFWVLVIQIIISVVDFSSGYIIRNLFFEGPDLPGRFLGFNHEPRALGRNSLFAYLLINYLYAISNGNDKYALWGKFIALISIIISFSLSTYISFFILKLIGSKRNFRIILRNLIGGLVVFFIIMQIPFVKEVTLLKFNRTLLEGNTNSNNIEGPEIFSHFEFYDTAYLNFVYENPEYLFFGTGPNLINIAYEKYAVQNFKLESDDFQGYYVSTSPTIGLFRLLARSGIIGVVILLFFLFQLRKKIKRIKDNRLKSNALELLIQSSILFFIIYNQWFYFILGILVFEIYKDVVKNNSNNKIYL